MKRKYDWMPGTSSEYKMTPSISIKFSGTLGERHRHLNKLVHDAYLKNTPFSAIQEHPEESAVERLFKIDLASKQRNVDYIIHTLKNDDMLFVSRALKSMWLLELEHSNIINPSFLENELFTQMTLQAANKTRHWVQMHLKDPQRCSEFYQFYKGKDFDLAAKFLWHCSNEYILEEITHVLEKLTPKHLKVLSEKVPQVTKIYYEHMKQDQTVLKYYLDNELKFFQNVKFLLKADADVFFYVIENFFVFEKFPTFSSEITKHILTKHKSRFMAKPELYTRWFLNMETLTKCLNSEEVKDLVIKLAKAEFLSSWFSYKRVAPMIKTLSVDERTALKKIVFVDKALGASVKEWPYPIPARPVLTVPQTALFKDRKMEPLKPMQYMRCAGGGGPFVSLLDQLFDKYRFNSYEKTLIELRKRLRAESSPQNREYMLLVLVSKTGGHAENMASLLELLMQYKNEPIHVRAAVVRSLVKRAFVWRLAPEHWKLLLEWGHGLGLDGSLSEDAFSDDIVCGWLPSKPKKRKLPPWTEFQNYLRLHPQKKPGISCVEGLHAVVIRDLLANVTPNDAVWKAFLDNFSPLVEYSLSSDERNSIRTRLAARLLAEAQSRPDVALDRLPRLLDVLTAYHMRFDEIPGTIEAIATVAKSDFKSAIQLLSRLYKAGVARKTLIRENFKIMQSDASYVNALRHDVSILEKTERFEELIAKKNLKHDQFLRKLALYFTEKDGLAERYRALLKLRAATKPDKTLARPLALLAGSSFPSLLKTLDAAAPKTPQRQLSAALRSNAHVVRPLFDLETFGWRAAGAKTVANRVSICRQKDVERYLLEALTWHRTLRLALVLAKRINKEQLAYEVLASKRPGAALKAALKYFQREGDNSDPRIWHTVKPHIAAFDQKKCHYTISDVKCIPSVIKPEYCVAVYRVYKKSCQETALQMLYHISDIIHEVEVEFILEELETYLRNVFTEKNVLRRYYDRSTARLYVDLIVKFLLLSTSEAVLQERLQRIGLPFLKRIEHMSKGDLLDDFISSLSYNRAFFDTKYSACSLVFEKLMEWMHSCLPMEKRFQKYARVHLKFIYLKTVRFCLELCPELFADESRKLKEGVDMLGIVYGKFIVKEVEESIERYFPSVVHFYARELELHFVRLCFNGPYDSSIENFQKRLLKGMLSGKEMVSAYIMAKRLYERLRSKSEDDDGISGMFTSCQKSTDKELCFRAQIDESMSTS